MKIKHFMDNTKGLTLVEVMAAVLILSLIIVTLYAVYDYSLSSYLWGEDYANNQDQGRLVMQKITKMVRNGFDIDVNDEGNYLDVLTDGKLVNSFDDDRFWNFKVKPPRDSLTLEAPGVAGIVYQETIAPYALIKPTTNGHIQVEALLNASFVKPGSAAFIHLIGPKTENEVTTPNYNNYAGVKLDGYGNLSVVENVYGQTGTVWTHAENIDINKEHILRLGLEPKGYNESSHFISIYLDNKLLDRIERPRDGLRSINGNEYGWVAGNNLAYVRLGLESDGSDNAAVTWTNFKIFYNSYKYYRQDKRLYYKKNEEPAIEVADNVGKFNVVKKEPDPVVDIELTFGDPEKEKNRSYTLNSSVKFQGR